MKLELKLQDQVTRGIEAKLKALAPGRINQILRDPLRGFWRDHLKTLPTNRRGWPSTGFWEKAADSVEGILQQDLLIIRCSRAGVRQRYLGGRISPVRAKALTIPISPISYGRRASEFSGLFLLKTKKGAYLVQPGQTITSTGGFKPTRETGKGRRKNEARRRASGLHFLFKLSPGVNQKGNPNVVPSMDAFAEVAMAAIERSVPS